jgi:NADH-quinone oxidoreductase subunit H
VGVAGVLQPISDAIKLFSKETVLPNRANIILFTAAPILSFILALIG